MTSTSNEQCGRRQEKPHSPDAGDQLPPNYGTIEVRLRESTQLFDALDPSPFHEKELGHHIEEWIIESAKEFPTSGACSLIIHLDHPGDADQRDVGDAIRAHFERKSRGLRREFRNSFVAVWSALAVSPRRL